MNDIERIKRSCKKLTGVEPSDEDIEDLFKSVVDLSESVAKQIEKFGITIKNLRRKAREI